MDTQDECKIGHVTLPALTYLPQKFFFCNKCKKNFLPWDFDGYEFGTRYFPKVSRTTNCYICDDCYHYLPRISYCATCNEKFASRNSLFRHLKETNHYC